MEVKTKLLDLVREKIRFKHYSYSTERTYAKYTDGVWFVSAFDVWLWA